MVFHEVSKLASDIRKALCTKIDIKHRMTEANLPQANGQAERTNQTVKQCLRFAHDEGLHWYDAVNQVEMTIKTKPIGNTPYSPYLPQLRFRSVYCSWCMGQ